tara:strand:+ start:954 stop:2288 length:1335 start_codon:yes stop_codon:yes gene_type:complete
MAKKIYVLDTSACLTNSNVIFDYGYHDIVIPLKVLEEIDKHKKRQDGVGSQARRVIRILDNLREKGSLKSGVKIAKGKGTMTIEGIDSSVVEKLPYDLDPNLPDHIIIATALAVKQRIPNRKVIMVSRDINLRVISDSIGLQSEDYIATTVIKDTTSLYTGFLKVLVDDEFVDQFYEGDLVFLEEERVKCYANQLLMLVSSSNDKKTALARFIEYSKPLSRVINYKKGLWGVKARNKEQTFAMDLLTNPDIPVVSLIGKAGSGKTLCAIAAGLSQVMAAGDGSEPVYKRLIVSRPVQPLGKDIGFLPGTIEEKMTPWLAPVQDNLRYLLGDDNATLDMYVQKGTIEIEALTYIRGRSISNAYVVIDEAQNLTTHEIKTIITRVGENTKIVLTGDIEQIDNVYVDETSNGLVHAVEKFKHSSLAGHITLEKGERSKVATLAAKLL